MALKLSTGGIIFAIIIYLMKDSCKNLSIPQYTYLYYDRVYENKIIILSRILNNKIAALTLFSKYGTLKNILLASDNELLNIQGISERKIKLLKSIFSLAEILGKEEVDRLFLCNSPQAVYNLISPYLLKETREVFICLPMDCSLRLLCPPVVVSIGTSIETIVHPREYFNILFRYGAISSIAVHNHPSSGNPTPSLEDKKITNQLIEVGKIVGIPLNDHIIIGSNSYYSFTEKKIFQKK